MSTPSDAITSQPDPSQQKGFHAKRGDPRAAEELNRRGRSVLFAPSNNGAYPPPKSITTFSPDESESTIVDLLRSLRNPH